MIAGVDVQDGLGDWVGPLYDDLLADMLLRRDPSQQETDFLIRELAIDTDTRVLDQGCGIGSLAIPLGRAGAHVIGVDQSAAYVAEARDAARAAGIVAEFHAADACDFRPGAPRRRRRQLVDELGPCAGRRAATPGMPIRRAR